MIRDLSFIFLSTLLGASTLAFAQSPRDLSDIEQGEYLVKIAGCADCHTAQADQPMAGGYRLETPFGDFFSPNITPDRATGIGLWSEEDFRNALRSGVSPSGRVYYPAFPYRSFSKISDEDIRKMYLYLKSLQPIHRVNRPHQLNPPYNQRWLMHFWKLLFFRRGPLNADPSKSEQWNRGAYLAEALSHCAECHTPRNFLGGLKTSEWMAGSDATLGGRAVPNITPDETTGLASWSKEDWLRFLSSGYTPQFGTPAAEMADVIQNTSSLTKEDREALVEYLISLPPVFHDVKGGSP